MLTGKRLPQRQWLATATGWAESTLAELSWEASRGAARRYALWGGGIGLVVGLVAFAPAAWLVRTVNSATNDRLILGDARGTVWSGSAVLVLTGGSDSRDARSLPGRLQWRLGTNGFKPELRLTHACCLNGTVHVGLKPGFGRLEATVLPPAAPRASNATDPDAAAPAVAGGAGDWIGQWPGALLDGLGTPWNTLALGGSVRLSTPGLTLEWVQGRWRMSGSASLELLQASSRLSTLPALGSYRFTVSGDPAAPGTSQLSLTTLEGALQLNGTGTWGATGVRFTGDASAAPADEPALSNLLNIIGRRNGARSVISIG